MSDVRSSFELGLQAMWIPELQLFPAQKLLRAQFLMRNRVVAEENRSMLSIKEALIEKSRLEIQVQCNRDLSRSTQKIDFDYLVCRNHDHWNEIDMLTDHITRLKTLHSKFVLFLVKIIIKTALMVVSCIAGQRELLRTELLELGDYAVTEARLTKNIGITYKRLRAFDKHAKAYREETRASREHEKHIERQMINTRVNL